MPHLLEPELETFERHRDELLGKAEGKFVLIFQDQIVGIFDTQNDAIQHGYRTLGNIAFLVKQVLKVETPQNFSSQHSAVYCRVTPRASSPLRNCSAVSRTL